MKNPTRRLAGIIGVAALCFTIQAFGQVTVNFTGPISTSPTFEGAYTDPYAGTVTSGAQILNPNGLLICDDFADHVSNGETWQANAIQVSTLTLANIGQTLFGSTIGLNGYAAVASLVELLINTNNTQTQADLSAAIWYITDKAADNPSGGLLYLGAINSSDVLDTAAANYVTTAEGTYGALLGPETPNAINGLLADTNLTILDPTTSGPQEMFMVNSVNAPEGGATALYLLFAGVACFGTMRLKSRNQGGRRIAA
jgi:hypothetical protein